MRSIEKRDRLEPVIAGLAMPEIGDAARAVLDPVGRRDRLAALSAGIFSGQIAEIGSSHDTSPFAVLLERELDRLADGYQRAVLSPEISLEDQ